MKATAEAYQAAPQGEVFDQDCLHVSLLQLQTLPFFGPLMLFHLQEMWDEIHADWPEHVGAS